MVSIKHKFTSGKADGADVTVVKPSNWNDTHDITTTALSVYLGRDKSAAGAAQELPVVTSGAGDDGTIWSAAKVQEAINAAVSAIAGSGVPMGTIVASTSVNMPGYLPLDGTTFGAPGSGATWESVAYQALYTHMWQYPTVFIEGSTKGANAAADWAAGKFLGLPISAGCVLGAAGGALNGPWFNIMGEDTHVLSVAEMPNHSHQIDFFTGANSGLGGVGSGSSLWQSGEIHSTYGTGGGAAHNNIQRTMVAQVFWIKT